MAKLLEAIGPEGDRGARFVCVAALALPDGTVVSARGECAGRILEAPRGRGGFGYDPVFQPEGRPCSMAELAPRDKNAISHRARALNALLPALRAHVLPTAGPADRPPSSGDPS